MKFFEMALSLKAFSPIPSIYIYPEREKIDLGEDTFLAARSTNNCRLLYFTGPRSMAKPFRKVVLKQFFDFLVVKWEIACLSDCHLGTRAFEKLTLIDCC